MIPVSQKLCPACGIVKPREDYYKKLLTISHKCKPCSLLDSKSRAPRYAGKYRAYQDNWRRVAYATSETYRNKISETKKACYAKRKLEINAARRKRWAEDPYNPARLYFRRKDIKFCTPKWVNKKALLEIYANCPAGYHVDHIVPLRGIVDGLPISGLHVPWNLQYLLAADNLKKKNRIKSTDIPTLSDDI